MYKEAIRSPIQRAVSYTHLDVYKRQMSDLPQFSRTFLTELTELSESFNSLFSCKLKTKTVAVKAKNLRRANRKV